MKKKLRNSLSVACRLMKYSMMIMAVVCCLNTVLVANTVSAQKLENTTVSLSAHGKNISAILTEIETKTQLKFVYNPDHLKKDLVKGKIFKNERVKLLLQKLGYAAREEGPSVIVTRLENIQQPGRIVGKIIDDKGELLPGASIRIIELNKGITSSVDGTYNFNLESGTYTLEVSYISFQTKRIADVIVKDGQLTKLDIVLNVTTSALKEVVVQSSYKRESVNGLYAQQKNNASITDGISAEQIARTPDNNLGQVLKRISGVTTIDTRYVVVRGMTERYNQAMLDGVIIPSTDMNRRNFSFDVVPQELVSSVVVNKTASADMSAEFSGGQILINTLDIPDQNFTSFTIGTGYNTRTTGEDFVNLGGRSTSDYFGFDNGRRKTPMDLQSWTQRNDPIPSYAVPQSRRFDSQPLKAYVSKARPNQNYRFSLGRLYQLRESLKLGFSGGLTYRNTQETNPFETIRRSGITNTGGAQPIDSVSLRSAGNLHKFNTTLGGVFNAGLQGEKFKLASKNYYSHVFNETLLDVLRVIPDENDRRFKELLTVPEYTTVYQNKLEGENLVGNNGLKFNWNGALTDITQDIKDLRRISYNKTATIGGVDYYDSPNASVFSDAVGIYDYRLSTRLNERDYNWTASLSQPFDFLKDKSVIKAGYAGWHKKRSLNSAQVRIIRQDLTGGRLTGRYEDIMAPDRIGATADSAFYYADHSLNGTQYTGTSGYHSAYLMLDQRFFQRLRVVYGLRAENFDLANRQEQFLRAPNYDGFEKINPFITGEKNWRFLPSVNATYSLTRQMNFRAAYSITMVRPDFRESSYFELYDAYLDAFISGWNVVSTKIKNYDLRYEWYPGAGEIISVSAFYKDFDKPLELVAQGVTGGSGKSRFLRFQNQKKAVNKGLEMEVRKSLGFLADKQWLRDLTIFGNGTWMQSEVTAIDYKVVSKDQGKAYELVENIVPGVKRPLYGQSPWLVNAGINYNSNLFGANISYNRSDYRSYVVALSPNDIEYENGRNVVDLQLSTRLWKQKAELKLNISNLLDEETFYYSNPSAYKLNLNSYDLVGNGTDKYEKDKGDKISYRIRNGRTASLTFTYKF